MCRHLLLKKNLRSTTRVCLSPVPGVALRRMQGPDGKVGVVNVTSRVCTVDRGNYVCSAKRDAAYISAMHACCDIHGTVCMRALG